MPIIQFLIIQVIVFGGVIFFLKKILSKDTESAVSRLDRVYQDLLAKQKELQGKIEEAEKELAARKEEASKVAKKLKVEALDDIRQKEDKVLAEAREEAENIVKRARASADKMRHDIEQQVRAEMVEIAGNLIPKLFNENLMNEIHNSMFEDFISREDLDFTKVTSGLDKVVIKTAKELTPEQIASVEKLLVTKLNEKLPIESTVDKTLLAGMMMQFGTLVLDGTLANAIDETQRNTKKEILEA